MSVQANIHPDAQIGKGTVIEAFATVQGDVKIGENCWIGPGACIMDGARCSVGSSPWPSMLRCFAAVPSRSAPRT